jgi:glycogen(starch) synthase
MNIGLYCGALFPSSQRGGIQSYVLRLAKTLGASGDHRIHLLTDRPSDDSWTPLRNVELHVVHARWVPLLGRWLPGFGESWDIARAMRRISRSRDLDIVEFPNWEAPALVYNWLPLAPSVVRLSTCFAETMKIDGIQPGAGERFIRWAERSAARSSASLLTHTAAHRRYMAEETGVPEHLIRIVPLGIEIPEQPPPILRRPPQEPLQLLYVGRLEHRKGTLDLLTAISLVVGKTPPFRLTLVGRDRPHAPGGRTFHDYATEVLPSTARECLCFRDFLSDQELDREYRQCDIFVAPSLYESFGLTYIEAMRYGKPVIGCSVGGVPEVVLDGRTGLLVQPGQPQALAGAIVALLTDSELRMRMGRAAYDWVRANFSVEVMAARTIDAYKHTLSSRGRIPSAGHQPPGVSASAR